LFQGTLDPHGAAMQFNKPLGQRQSQPGALDFASEPVPDLLKLLKNALLVFWSNAYPGIPDGNLYGTVHTFGNNADFALVRREFHRIGEEIKENLFHFALIAADHAEVVCHVERQDQTVCQSTLLDHDQTALQHLSEVEHAQFQLHLARLDLGEV